MQELQEYGTIAMPQRFSHTRVVKLPGLAYTQTSTTDDQNLFDIHQFFLPTNDSTRYVGLSARGLLT